MSTWRLIIASLLCLAQVVQAAVGTVTVSQLSAQFVRQVDRRLDLPLSAQQRYISLVMDALAQSEIVALQAQTFLAVDRNPFVQAAFLLLRTEDGQWHWLGATAVSTGRPGGFEHFVTPVGVFLHSPNNPDYRSAGTFNENHIRGYGERGMRIFDFGWQVADRTWGKGGRSPMRLAMHATDPNRLEARLGSTGSEGCIRIPASLNRFLDHYGVLDAEYEIAVKESKPQRVLAPDREPLPWPGRYLVVIDSGQQTRPAWSSEPVNNRKPSLGQK